MTVGNSEVRANPLKENRSSLSKICLHVVHAKITFIVMHLSQTCASNRSERSEHQPFARAAFERQNNM